MRTRLTSRLSLLFLSFAMVLALPAMALADTLTVSNTLITNTDTSKAPGGTGTANVWLDPTNSDPTTPDDETGCNASTATGQAAKVTLSSTNSAISFPNGASADLTACGSNNAKQIAYKVADNATAGQAVIRGTVTGGKSGQTNQYNVNDALTVTITAPAKQNTAVSNVSGSGTYHGSADLTATLKTAAGTALSGKSVTFTLNGNAVGSATTNASGVATKSVSLSGIDAGTYTNHVSANFAGDTSNNGSTASGDLTVAKAAGSVSIDNIPANAGFGGSFTPGYTKAGDGTPSTTSNTLGVCSVSGTGVVNFDAAGTCKLQASVTEGTNHRAATGSEQTFEIAKAPATLSFASGTLSKTYNGSAQGVTVNTAPENLSGVSISYFNKNADGTKGSALSGAPTNAGSYIAEASLTNNNYQARPISDTLVIAKKALSAEANNDSRQYGNANHAFTGTLTGAISGDNITASYSSAADENSDVGTYAIVPALNDPDNRLANYDVTKTNGTLTVTKAPLSAKATNATKVYGDALGAADLTGTLSGVKNGDPIAVSYSSAGAAASSDVGDYAIVPALDTTAAVLSNYGDPVLTNGTLSVTKAPLVIKADDTSRFYGDPNPAFTGSVVSGLKNNDVLNLSFTTTALQNSPVGTYAIVPEAGGAKAGNYLVSARNGVLTIGSWTFKGFYQPVDMSGTLNTVKGGSTVPIKFELFKGATELTDTASINQPLRATKVACESGATVDEIELVAAGATALRYDATGGQFVYNWKTPTGTGTCYKVTITANDGSSQTAHFKLK